jgi:hypothetical protein
MSQLPPDDEAEARGWVHYHIIAFFGVIGVACGLMIVDAKTADIIGASSMPGFRSVLLLSVLLTGVGARALLAWRSGTVDLQGRVFLTVTGLALLTGAAFGLSDCYQEVKERYDRARQNGQLSSLVNAEVSPTLHRRDPLMSRRFCFRALPRVFDLLARR